MMHPLLTLAALAAIQVRAEPVQAADFVTIVADLAETSGIPVEEPLPADEELTVRDVRYYYDDFHPFRIPAAPVVVTYDWRSPVILDRP